MNAKSLSLFVFAILSFAILASFASAAITTDLTSLTFNNQYQSIPFAITTSNAASIPSSLTISDGHGRNAVISFNRTSILAPSTSVTATASVDTNFLMGQSFPSSLLITDSSNSSNNISIPISFQKIPSEYVDNGHLDVSVDDIYITKGLGEDYKWYPLDELNAKIVLENKGNDRIRDLTIRYGLYDYQKGTWVFKDSQSLSSLSTSKTVSVNFKLDDLSKFNPDNSGDYLFYAWASGYDEGTSNKTSSYGSKNIEMTFDSDLVKGSNMQIPESASCGQSIEITADISNIGLDYQRGVYVVLVNTQLGLNKKILIGDIDSMETLPLNYAFTLPNDVEEGTYDITLVVYDEKGRIYESDLNKDVSRSISTLKVSGSCSLVPLASVSANLDSDVKAGQEFTVKATITNTGSKLSTFNLELNGYSDWASLVNLDRNFVTLNAGESQNVLIKLKANTDASGENKFNINLKQGSKILSQPISVAIKNGFSFPNLTGFFSKVSGGNNLYLWGIGALNVILVLIIIFVAARVVRKK